MKNEKPITNNGSGTKGIVPSTPPPKPKTSSKEKFGRVPSPPPPKGEISKKNK